MQKFADPELIKQMGVADKMAASLVVTMLGMGITFVVLTLLWGMIAIMTKVLTKPIKKAEPVVITQPSATPVAAPAKDATLVEETDESLIAVITAAIAASIQRPAQTIIVKNIRRSTGGTPAWASAAKQEQLDSRRM